jgi:putative NADH-flavin reductase
MNVLIVGATGNLGKLIVHEALKNTEWLNVNVMVRNISKASECVEMIKKAGGKVFEADITKPETFKDITKGMHTVISALIGGEDVILEGQTRLLEDAERNGVVRFIPSDFSFDIWNFQKGRLYFTDLRLKFKERLDKSKVKGLHFSVG